MLNALITRLKSAVSPPEPAAGLTAADRKAFKAYFAECDSLEPGLGRAINAFVTTGQGEPLLLRLRALPQHDIVLTGHLPDEVRTWHETNGFVIDKEASAKNVPINIVGPIVYTPSDTSLANHLSSRPGYVGIINVVPGADDMLLYHPPPFYGFP